MVGGGGVARARCHGGVSNTRGGCCVAGGGRLLMAASTCWGGVDQVAVAGGGVDWYAEGNGDGRYGE